MEGISVFHGKFAHPDQTGSRPCFIAVSSYMPLKRITRKIEQILREEMDAVDGRQQ